MLQEVLWTGAAALTAGALSVPAARNLFLGGVDTDWLAGELELDEIAPDGHTVNVKSGVVFRVYRLRGVSYDAKILEQQARMLKGRSALFHALAEDGCTFRLFGVKRQSDISFEAKWPSPALREIGNAEKRLFKSSYYIEWFLVLSANSIKNLIDGSSKITSMAGEYRPTLLSRPDDPLEPCQLTGFLNYLVCGDLRYDLPAVSRAISGSLPAADLHIEKNGLITARTPNRQIHCVIAVRAWPEQVNGLIFHEIMSLQGDIEISQICEPWDRDKAKIFLKRNVTAQTTAFFGNPSLAAESALTEQLLTEGSTTVFHSQLQIIVRADNEKTLDENVEAVCSILGRKRIVHSVETEGAPICWFNRIPSSPAKRLGSETRFLRPLLLREENLAALWAFNNSPAGMPESPMGDRPVRFFRTPGGQAYAFQFHVKNRKQAIGNYLVFAPSGGGKSTLMMHLLGGLTKFPDVRSYIFDSKEGARFMIEAMGGVYQGYDDLQLNPLDVGDTSPQNQHRMFMVLKSMAAGIELDEDADAEFNHAVKLAFQLDAPDRTLNAIYEYAFRKKTTLRKAFARWVTDSKGNAGINSHIFNAPRDSLSSFLESAPMVGINMNEALDDPVVGPPIVAHISSAIYNNAARNPKPFSIFIDEAAKLLQNDGFKSLAVEMFREYRKLDGSVGLAFQDPAALFRSGQAEAFLENSSTLIFLPNSQASNDSLEPFNLNDEQKSFILEGGTSHENTSGAAEARHVLVIKRDAAAGIDESAILDVDLSPLGESLRFYRAGPQANKHLKAVKDKWGEEWLNKI